ncbi:SDR family NAD(P)-dependent oxidoreductase [Bryobacter aggregatus]|uniref:SDR family NAD(P)-dependent oxidoreductase n=1 Tax=Bryobacter aggregatus TaxID=360054 RepID=UPI00138DE1E1|nr:SDR family NAD(P)-dependent oxidoreductase [Bryobacter aggregatus]
MRIDGSKILLTGASTGIGATLAGLLHARGAHLVLVSRKTHTYELPGAHWIAADLTDAGQRNTAFAEAAAKLGGIDILINNAGVGAYVSTRETDEDTWRHLYELNLHAPIHLARLALPGMLAQRRGAIVNVCSIAALVPLPWFSLYSTTKAALLSFTHGLRMELDGSGVETVAVCPGYVQTPFQSHVISGKPPLMLQRTKAFAISPEVCAQAIVRGIESGKRTVVTPLSGHFLHWAYFLFPKLIDSVFARYNRNLERSAV